jgi:hypothetical protein
MARQRKRRRFRLPGLLFLAALLLLSCLVGAPLARAAGGAFVLVDELSPEQIEEDITVYLDDTQVGHIHLTREHPADMLHITAAEAPMHDYVLCGETLVQDKDGTEKRVPVNDSGSLFDPDGRTFAAYTEYYRAFFLRDITADKPAARIDIHLGPRCPAPVSWRAGGSAVAG